MKYYIIAGEASGDLHASNLIKYLKVKDPGFVCRAWGGDKMQAQGAHIVKHYRELAFMGFIEVIANLRTILRNIEFCKKDILEFRPDAIILVDYPGFNLRIAAFAKSVGIRVIYYISPQIWAWKQSRVHQIKKNVDRMLVILPFEKEFYARFNYPVDFVGHPLLDAVAEESHNPVVKWKSGKGWGEEPVIALLPGSRRQEIATMLPVMLKSTSAYTRYRLVVAGAPSIPEQFYKDIIGDAKVNLVFAETYELLSNADAAVVTSGTATLETALFGVPEVVCYKGNKISYHIARKLVKVQYISLVNLIMGKEIVKELIQDEMNADAISGELDRLLNDANYRQTMKNNLNLLREKLGGEGASERAATLIVERINGIS